MNGRHGLWAVMLAATLALIAAASATSHAGVVLSGHGTPTIDGVLAPGEWDAAARLDFAARIPSNDGGGTAPGSLYVMNDGTNLYFALRVARPGAPRGSFYVAFDNDHDGITSEEGGDAFVANPGAAFFDIVWTGRPPCPIALCGLLDTTFGGTSDGWSATGTGSFVYEVAKPLDSADDANDIGLRAGDIVGFGANIQVWSVVPSCNFGSACVEDTLIVNDADIVVAGLDTTPPVLAVPTGLNADATTAAGATVHYDASATDDVDGDVPVSCLAASGSTFPIGTTTVNCTATDAAGNVGSASFDVHVKGGPEQLADLEDAVVGLGPGSSLADKVADARVALVGGEPREACEILAAFDNQVSVQGGKSIPQGTATELEAVAARIRAVLGC